MAERRRPRDPDTRLWRLVESGWFTAAVSTAILCNAVVLAIQTYDHIEREHGRTLDLLNNIFLAIFVVELGLRIASYGRRPQDFFRSGWNLFDFIVIGAAFIPGVRQSSTLLRIVRLARVVRVVGVLPHVRVLVSGIIRSLPPLGSMFLLTVIMLFVYGMLGWILFGEAHPKQWGDIDNAMLTLFIILTFENFPVYLQQGMEVHNWSWIYFVSFVLMAAIIVLNVFIGIVLNSMEEAREGERRRQLGIGDEEGELELPPVQMAPILERIAILRAALTELEEELAAAQPAAGAAGQRPG